MQVRLNPRKAGFCQGSLKRHRGSIHRQSLGFSCQVCSQRFYRKDHLGRHLKTHQPVLLLGDSKQSNFMPVITKTFYKKLKSTVEERDLANKEEYPLRNSDFAIKRREQKVMMNFHHQHRPLTPRRIPTIKHEGNV